MNFIINFITENFDILTLLFVFVLTLSVCNKSVRYMLILFSGLVSIYTILAIFYNYGYGSKMLYDWSIDVIISILMIFKCLINVIHSSPLHFIHCEDIVGVLYFLSQSGFDLILSIKTFNFNYKIECPLYFINKKFDNVKIIIKDKFKFDDFVSSFNFALRI